MNGLHKAVLVIGVVGWSLSASAFWLSEGDGKADPVRVQSVDYAAIGLYPPSHMVELPDERLLVTVQSFVTNEAYVGVLEGTGVFNVVWSWTLPDEEYAPPCEDGPEIIGLAAISCQVDSNSISALVKYNHDSCVGANASRNVDLLVIPLVTGGSNQVIVTKLDYNLGYTPQYAFTPDGLAINSEPLFGEPALYDTLSLKRNLAKDVLAGHDPARVDLAHGIYVGDADADGDADLVITKRSRASKMADAIPLPAPQDLESEAYWQLEEVWQILPYEAAGERFGSPQDLTPNSLNLMAWSSPFFTEKDVFTTLATAVIPGTRTVSVEWMLTDGRGLESVQVLQDSQTVFSTNALPGTMQQWISGPLPLETNLVFQVVAVDANTASFNSWTQEIDIPPVIVSMQASVTNNGVRLDWQLDPPDAEVDGTRIIQNGTIVVDWYDLDPTNRLWTTEHFPLGVTNLNYFLQVLAPRGQMYDANPVEVTIEDKE